MNEGRSRGWRGCGRRWGGEEVERRKRITVGVGEGRNEGEREGIKVEIGRRQRGDGGLKMTKGENERSEKVSGGKEG
jgi:hypothetical protein